MAKLVTYPGVAIPAPVTTRKARERFSAKEHALWKEIAQTQSASHDTDDMRELVVAVAESLGGTVEVDNGNVYVTKGVPKNGKPYPCLVAHTDTVFKIIPYKDREVRRSDDGKWYAVDNATWRVDKDGQAWVDYTGLGGDDKCGIFLALNAMRRFAAIKCAFFRDEEVGCQGSAVAKMEFFNDCAFVLQGDRKGNTDFVDRIWGPLSSPEFMAAVRPLLGAHGFTTVTGASNDVGEL